MANKQLPDFITAENDLDGSEPVYIAQNSKTRKTLLSKIKDFIIGTTSMGTTATDVTGAVAELKGKIDSNTSSLNDLEYESVNKTITVGNGQMFETIQEAIDSIKKYIQYNTKIKIECNPGTYNEDIKLGGFYGGGTIEINTNKSAISLQSIILEKCNIEITLNNLTLTSTTNHSIAIVDCNDSIISYCEIGGDSSSNSGIFVMNSNVIIKNTSISGKYCGIVAYENSNICSDSNTGSGNYIGLNVGSNSVIGKDGTQPSGTTMETTKGGGVIR